MEVVCWVGLLLRLGRWAALVLVTVSGLQTG